MNCIRIAVVCCLLGTGLPAIPVFAQNETGAALTEAEIVDRFNQQKTRGLSIAPVVQSGNAGAADATAVTTTVGGPILPVDQQVNINISFDFDSAALREDQKPKLVELCGAMKAMEGERFNILGHTDSSGSEAYNQRLSKLRAEEVKRFLVGDCGLSPDRLQATGVGESRPFDPNDPRADVNRRVEFQLIS